jgi:hypothetical protein
MLKPYDERLRKRDLRHRRNATGKAITRTSRCRVIAITGLCGRYNRMNGYDAPPVTWEKPLETRSV